MHTRYAMARNFVTLALCLAVTLSACESLGRRRARSADDLFNALPEITQHKVDSFLDDLLSEDDEHILSKREAHGDADADSDSHPQRFGVGQRRTNPPALTASGFKEPFGLGEVVNNLYRANSWNGTWVSDTEYAYRNRDGLQLLSVVTGRSQTLVPSSEMTDVFRYYLSPDQSYVLLAIRPQKLFRHSFIAVYDIYDVRSGRRISLEPPASVVRSLGGPGPEEDAAPGGGPPPQLPLLYAEWAPVGNGIAYVFSNNIFYRPSPQGRDVVVTTSGVPGTVFNGIADWVYEEEVLSDTRALWFSPDGQKLAWVQFNDSDVDVMPLEIYGQPGRLEFQYPIPTPLRYPKPGRTNPFVNVFVASLSRAGASSSAKPLNALRMPEPNYFRGREKIIYAAQWATNTELALTWENRDQNYAIVSVCDVDRATCRDSLVMTENKGWLELDKPPIFTRDGRQFAMALSADNFTHVNIVNRDTNQRVPVTSGEMVVTELYHWDEDAHVIYFRATRAGSPGERHLYTVTDFESGRPGTVTCISCDVTNSRGGACGFNTFDFSKKKTYYTMSCKGPHVPQDYLYQAPDRYVAALVTNAGLSAALSDKHLPKISNLDVEIQGKWRRYKSKVRLYLPHDFDDRKKYPMLVNVYAGPNSQQVNDRFKLDWGAYLTTSEQVIYAVIDGRGSGFQGDEMLMEIYKDLGGPEVQDQMDVTRRLIELYSFIDRDNVAIWGWSYGGFVTLSALADDRNRIFKCGIAVAPVTNWIYYDTIYTERYMGLPTPDDNLVGYRRSDVTAKAADLRGKKLLLVHGTADDNVHYQQTMMVTRALEEEDVLFQQIAYPDENHGIVGLRPHFYHTLSNFILNDCFGKNVTRF